MIEPDLAPMALWVLSDEVKEARRVEGAGIVEGAMGGLIVPERIEVDAEGER